MENMKYNTFVFCHRILTFFDEWLFYALLIFLYALHKHYDWPLWPFTAAAIIGTISILNSYGRQWEMEKRLDR